MIHSKISLFLLTTLFLLILISSCKQNKSTIPPPTDEHVLLNEDSLELAAAYRLQHKIKSTVHPSLETEPVMANSTDDAADDPAIWFNEKTPSKSLIFGSNKKGGLVASNLEGKTVQYYELGSINNVDITYDFLLNKSKVPLLGCSNRTTQSIDLFSIGTNGDLLQLNDDSFKMDTTIIDDIYGFCFGKIESSTNQYVFINGKNGLMLQYLMVIKNSQITLKLVREVQFESQTEGMVADQKSGNIYVGEEGKGIWMLSIDPSTSNKIFISGSSEKNVNISYDIEGITIYRKANTAYLIASSQGNFSYAVFDINDANKYLGSFKISGNNEVDGAEETDGIAINTDSLSIAFPSGIFVAQDGFNYKNDSIVPQNFKYVDVKNILDAIDSFEN